MKFILASGIADDIRAERWSVVARVYNGPGYKKNRYDAKMASEFRKLRGVADSGWAPDAPDPRTISVTDTATLKSVQRRLRELGYHEVGKVDGVYGTKLRAGVLGFRADNDLPIVADIDDELLAALMVAEKRPVAEPVEHHGRGHPGHRQPPRVDAGDKQQVGGGVLAATGIVGAATKALGIEEGGTFTEVWATVKPVYELVEANGIYLAIALGVFIVWQAHRAKQARVADEREAIHVGRG